MKKNILFLLSVPLLSVSSGNASALTAEEQLKATKEIFVSDFKKMDDNKDGKLSLEEYLNHQFENFRANIIEADGFDGLSEETSVKEAEVSAENKTETKNELKSLNDVNNALQEMADFDIDFDDEVMPSGEADSPVTDRLTMDDVMPAADSATETEKESSLKTEAASVGEELDLSVSEEDNLKSLLAEINESPEEKVAKEAAETAKIKAEAEAKAAEEKAAADEAERDRQILAMTDTIRKTLPKKVDEVTTWTDIEYKDRAIAYIYQADVDSATFSSEEKKVLGDNIKKEACSKAYKEMCPKLKPVFIDAGITVSIHYQDKGKNELGVCLFNKETCL